MWMSSSVIPGTKPETESTKEHNQKPEPEATKIHNDSAKATALNGRTVHIPRHWHISDHSHIAWSQGHWKTSKEVPQMSPSPQPHTLPYSEMQSRMKLSKCDVSPSKALNQSSVVTLAAYPPYSMSLPLLSSLLLCSSSPLRLPEVL